MKKTRGVFALAGFVLGLTMFLPSVSAQGDDPVRKDLEAAYEKFNAAIVARDINAVMEFYDPKFTLQVEDESMGRTEVESIWKGQFREMDYAFSKTTIDKISVLPTGYVIAYIRWEYKATQTKNGKKSLWEVQNKSADIWGKASDGQWRLFNREDEGSEGKVNGKPLKH